MERFLREQKDKPRMTFGVMSVPAKVLATCIIVAMSFGMLGALGQIVVHDIIPTFYSSTSSDMSPSSAGHDDKSADHSELNSAAKRGDLFSQLAPAKTPSADKPFYKGEQFVWTLKWTHIHLFGMSMIFLFMGVISLLLDAGSRLRTWLIILPFIGVLIDILAMWLKAFISPVFFWLHIPGGGIFGLIFGYVSLRALWEMWLKPASIQ
ncbi:MAG: hypothetical protein U9Q05_06960 [Thermodesulfobacteriota bacterium]|nr:hypothetical protein [Thermodesulfobacteriota bacterium]